jgi:NADPH-dependent F420 reductase
MKITILGTGGVGAALGPRWAKEGHDVTYGSRAPESEKVQQLVARSGERASATSPMKAIQGSDVIVLALPWPVAHEMLGKLGELNGRVLIDCTNPLLADLSGIECGHLTSAAEQIAGWSPGAKVVKAFNTASVKVMNDPKFGEQAATMFYCGDDGAAKQIVHRLAAELGFDPVDAGSLISARYLEPLAMLYIHLAVKQGWGGNCAFKILKR